MGYVESERNKAVSTVTADGGWCSLHSADPGTTGASELSGARVQTTWGAPSAGVSTGSDCVLDVAAGETPTHAGVWTAQTGGTFLGGAPLASPPGTYSAAGTYTLTPQSSCPA